MLRHKAIVVDVTQDGTALVEVARSSACSACGEKSSCTIADDTSIKLRFKNSSHLTKGDIVEIGIEKRNYFKSLVIIYIIPLILMLLAAIITDAITTNQLITAGATLTTLSAYFIALKFIHKGKDKQSYKII